MRFGFTIKHLEEAVRRGEDPREFAKHPERWPEPSPVPCALCGRLILRAVGKGWFFEDDALRHAHRVCVQARFGKGISEIPQG